MGNMIKILLVILLGSGTLFAQVKENSIVLKTKNGDIHGSILMPDHQGEFPVVLIIAGSGPTDRNGNNPMMKNNSLKMLAEGLAERGIASVRYDKRGIGESKQAGGDEKSLRFENYIDDAKDWIDFLHQNDSFTDIVVLGHSEGSLIGMIAAQKEEVNKYISLAGIGDPASKAIREQLKSQPPFVIDLSSPILDKLESAQTVDSVPPILLSLFRPSVQPYLISWFKYDPTVEIEKLRKPVLIVQGTTDIQVPVSNADVLAQSNPQAQKAIMEGMNHILKVSEADRMKNIETYSNPDLPLHPDLIDILIDFLSKGN